MRLCKWTSSHFFYEKSLYLNLLYPILSHERGLPFKKNLGDTFFCDLTHQPPMERDRNQHIANNQWSCVNLIFITLKSLFLRNWFIHSTLHRVDCTMQKLHVNILKTRGLKHQVKMDYVFCFSLCWKLMT